MDSFEVTTITSRGQVIIPQVIRENLGIHPGNKFLVTRSGDAIILKKMGTPSIEKLKNLLAKTRAETRRKQFRKVEVVKAIKAVRKKKLKTS